MNIRYTIKTNHLGIVEITKTTPFTLYNRDDKISFSTSVAGWYNYMPAIKPDDTNFLKYNILCGKRYGYIFGTHTVSIIYRVNEDSTVDFLANVELRKTSRTIEIIKGIRHRQSIKFDIASFESWFSINTYVDDSNIPKYTQIDKLGERTWSWMGGSIIEPQWKMQKPPKSPLYLTLTINS
jgi:hypothetical protein